VARDVAIGQAETHLAYALIESGLRDHLAKNLPIKAERTGAVGRQGPPKLAADLLQAILVILPEAIDRDFGIADLGKRGAAKAAKNIVDAPDGEATGEHRHDRCHKAAAEPIFGRFANTSEHAANVENALIGTARRRTIKEGSVPSQPMATSRKAPLFRPQLVW